MDLTQKINEVLWDGLDNHESEEELVDRGFKVDSLSAANWCVAKMARANSIIAQAEAEKKELIARIDAWYEDHIKEAVETLQVMPRFLAPWIEQSLEGGKKRSMKLVNGTAGFRKTPTKVEIFDEERAVQYAEENGIPVKVKKSVAKTDLKRHLEGLGADEAPGAKLIPGSERFYVETEDS